MKFLFFLTLFLSCKLCLADIQDIKLTNSIFPYGGYNLSINNRVEFGIGYGYRLKTNDKISLFHITSKTGLEMNPSRNIFVPKIILESNFFILSARLSLMYEITKYENKLKLYLEMGLCLGSYVNVMFQYTGLDSHDVPSFSSQKISINFNIPINFPEKK